MELLLGVYERTIESSRDGEEMGVQMAKMPKVRAGSGGDSRV